MRNQMEEVAKDSTNGGDEIITDVCEVARSDV
jgi:hypothetical protein